MIYELSGLKMEKAMANATTVAGLMKSPRLSYFQSFLSLTVGD